ncbi:PA2817 family protein [Pseudohaliea rubra]|uniref:Dehydrogenase n=1 Tax=Pseudohaliea rubra DSM 19751 TaxID=1265313 RepID=A0A095VQS0_9GAMM|nr:PA2817 family protein [Pseudohaliea rubra]KGE03453.1 hypothetical protein HRUBRA_01832 [Pseudohaliea rubra DSM 19751]
MDDLEYAEHCRRLLETFAREFLNRTRELSPADGLRELALAFGEISAGGPDVYDQGRELVSRLFTTYPDFAPTFPRELLWFFGGECLHYMADDEIAEFEQRQTDSA